MSIAIVTGAGGLIGSETVDFFHQNGLEVIGIDNDYRKYFFGKEASTFPMINHLEKKYLALKIILSTSETLMN